MREVIFFPVFGVAPVWLVLVMFRRSSAVEGVDDAGNDFDCGN